MLKKLILSLLLATTSATLCAATPDPLREGSATPTPTGSTPLREGSATPAPTGFVESPEPLRPVAAFYTAAVGSSSLTDTYLSPLTFRGQHYGLGYQRLQAMKFNPRQWVMQLEGQLSVDHATPAWSSAPMWHGQLLLSWGIRHRWALPVEGLTLEAGGAVTLDAGVLYINRSGNNPASAKAAITADLSAAATYNFTLGRQKLTLRYQPTMPLLGAFFSPQYDELYYEIYLGNHHHLAHCAWPGNRFALRHLVSLDFHWGNTVVRVGYQGSIMSSKVNHLTTNIFTHVFTIGFGGEWISLGNARRSTGAPVISAIY